MSRDRPALFRTIFQFSGPLRLEHELRYYTILIRGLELIKALINIDIKE